VSISRIAGVHLPPSLLEELVFNRTLGLPFLLLIQTYEVIAKIGFEGKDNHPTAPAPWLINTNAAHGMG
jgi:hypothetical protein